MNAPLHWSFDHRYHHPRGDFAHELIGVLDACHEEGGRAPGDGAAGAAHTYAILPNFWCGYKRPRSDTDDTFRLAIGSAAIVRRPEADGAWRYSVRYSNTTSGETLRLSFCCSDDALRTLRSGWQVRAANDADGEYERFECDGRLEPDGDGTLVCLRINGGPDLRVAHLTGSPPLTCNWALFDAVPAFLRARGPEPDAPDEAAEGFALLEDLEKLKTRNRLARLGNCELELASGALRLDGCQVHGDGNPPSYWWVDERGRVVIVSSIFSTLVLKTDTGTSEPLARSSDPRETAEGCP